MTLEEPDLISEESKNNNSDTSSENIDFALEQSKNANISETNPKDNNSIRSSDFNDKNSDNKSVTNELSLFNRFLKEGFDGITTNPNYKLLALLIILLINLSLFLLVGNLGKSFLENSGLLN